MPIELYANRMRRHHLPFQPGTLALLQYSRLWRQKALRCPIPRLRAFFCYSDFLPIRMLDAVATARMMLKSSTVARIRHYSGRGNDAASGPIPVTPDLGFAGFFFIMRSSELSAIHSIPEKTAVSPLGCPCTAHNPGVSIMTAAGKSACRGSENRVLFRGVSEYA